MNPLFKRLQWKQRVFLFFDWKDYLDRPQRNLRGFISRSENIAHPISWRAISPRDAGISVLRTASNWLLSTWTAGFKKGGENPLTLWQWKSGNGCLAGILLNIANLRNSKRSSFFFVIIIYGHGIRYGLGFGNDCWPFVLLLFSPCSPASKRGHTISAEVQENTSYSKLIPWSTWVESSFLTIDVHADLNWTVSHIVMRRRFSVLV